MKKILSVILSSFALVSCVDTVLLPDDKTVEEDFWQTKTDVEMMVNGAYSSMATANIQSRLVVWTSRSDELNVNTALNNSNLNQIYSANIQTTNAYNSWGDLYAVINNCNLVISKSESVMNIDPNYLEGDHQNNVAQMKALRSLCYFYLIRVFRDVPLILEPYKESSAEMNVSQSAPAVVLDQIIADLEEVKNNTLSSQNVSNWKRCGYFTRDGVYALLADVYLWKASIYGDESSYDKCIECCNTIRNNRINAAGGQRPSAFDLDDDGFNLNMYANFYNLFATGGNDDESLFELQYTDNTALCNLFLKYKKDLRTPAPQFYTNSVYAQISADDAHVFNHANYSKDARGFESVYSFNVAGDDGFMVRKMVANQGLLYTASSDITGEAQGEREYTGYDQNWIIYRVSDVMLMKAEALVQKAALRAAANANIVNEIAAATTAQDSLNLANQLLEVNKGIAQCNITAARQAQIISTRARTDMLSEIDSTKYKINDTEYSGSNLAAFVRTQVNTYNGFSSTAKDLEKLVMDERARELCFEGKRWFDLLRYNYRHTTGVNYNVILGAQGGAFAQNYDEMLKLIARKYTSGGGTGVTAKMPTEPYLYMPIIQSEIEVNPALVQNPVYTDGGTTEKNY